MSSVAPWRAIQRQNFVAWRPLFAFLQLPESLAASVLPQSPFPLNLPRRLAEKISKGTLDDPILKQFLPSPKELTPASDFLEDPVGDQCARKAPKLLHKYSGRALLLCTSACAMHCRYCFRRHFPYETQSKLFNEELDALAEDQTISEIILSGGDPLSLGNETLEALVSDLARIPHLQRLRIHTRFPLGIPERIDAELLSILEKTRLQVILVIHCNHPDEFDDAIFYALQKIQRLGIPILSQSVLLHGINDDLATLQKLCETLINAGILPYYLHQLDKVQGSSHFEVPEATGLALIQALATVLPGYAVPRYVKDLPQQLSKLPIC
jgi:EF-P beta-lysylation protein EpmB